MRPIMPNVKLTPYIPSIINGSILVFLVGWLLVVNSKTESMLTQQYIMIPEMQKLRGTVVDLQVTIAGMTPLLEVLAGVEIPPPDVLRRLENLERRMDTVQYGTLGD